MKNLTMTRVSAVTNRFSIPGHASSILTYVLHLTRF
jgi:hypothetical protein